jgi:probable H4MPT-linked C1 transfer pathway protein
LVTVLGFDIGGANTKAALITTKNGELKTVKVAVEYFPVWREPQKLATVLLALKQGLTMKRLDGVGVTMTAELSDAYNTKREGVLQILACVKQAFPDQPIYVLTTETQMVPVTAAEEKPLLVAAANWAATGWLVAQQILNCVVVDVGSTSASIIPVVAGHVVAEGKTDLDKLLCGELVYTGSLRTNVAAIVQSIPIRNGVAGVSSELFALSADIHLILGNITEKQYTCETADGRGKTVPESLARLARVVCADTEMLSKQEIVDMAKYVYKQQIKQVAEGLKRVYCSTKKQVSTELPVVVTGLGKDFIARTAAEQIGVDAVVDLSSLIQNEAPMATPAFGVALMTASKLKGEPIKWTPQ